MVDQWSLQFTLTTDTPVRFMHTLMQAHAVTGHYEHWSSPEDDSSTGIIDIPKARHHHTAQDAPSLTRPPRVGVGSRVHSFVRPGTSAFATGRAFHYRFLPNCHHRYVTARAQSASRHAVNPRTHTQ